MKIHAISGHRIGAPIAVTYTDGGVHIAESLSARVLILALAYNASGDPRWERAAANEPWANPPRLDSRTLSLIHKGAKPC